MLLVAASADFIQLAGRFRNPAKPETPKVSLTVQPNGHIAVAPPPRRGLSRVQAAEYVGISPSKFDQVVADGRMPGPKHIDGRRVWDVRAVELAFDALPGDGASEHNEWDS